MSLGNSTRLAITQHLARKSQTTRLPASNPISTMLGNYHHAPIKARRITVDVHPTAATRGDIHTDPIYLHHPLARNDLKSPLALTPASPSHTPVLIDNYYITIVHSSISSTANNYDIYLYLPNDYDSDNDLYSILSDQLKDNRNRRIPYLPDRHGVDQNHSRHKHYTDSRT